MSRNSDLYALLQITRNATLGDIKIAYRQLGQSFEIDSLLTQLTFISFLFSP